jgi:polyphosphate glucokinase
VLGGGNAAQLKPLPEGGRLGGNENAFAGGFRLWETAVAPLDRAPTAYEV